MTSIRLRRSAEVFFDVSKEESRLRTAFKGKRLERLLALLDAFKVGDFRGMLPLIKNMRDDDFEFVHPLVNEVIEALVAGFVTERHLASGGTIEDKSLKMEMLGYGDSLPWFELVPDVPASVTPSDLASPTEMPDSELTADQLEIRYSPDGHGEHPDHTRQDWRHAVENDWTLLGYWAWVQHALTDPE
jgi:hypothetical protein